MLSIVWLFQSLMTWPWSRKGQLHMILSSDQSRRPGSVAPVIGVSLVALCGAVALAIDVGRIAVAKLQCQSAADVAAMAGARTLNGIMPQDLDLRHDQCPERRRSRTRSWASPSRRRDVTVQHGTYHYDPTAQAFVPSFTLQTGENYNLTQVTITKSCPTTFASVFGFSAFSVTATATAAHRPRDVAIVLDYSGSMNNESDLWNNESYLDNGTGCPEQPQQDLEQPGVGLSQVRPLQQREELLELHQLRQPALPRGRRLEPPLRRPADRQVQRLDLGPGRPGAGQRLLVQRPGTRRPRPAFTPVPDASLDTYNRAGGDQYLCKQGSTTVFATTLQGRIWAAPPRTRRFESQATVDHGTASRATSRARATGARRSSSGPRTRPTTGGRTYFGTKDNTKLWDGSGNWRDPSGNYTINYKAILAWIKNTGANPFPSQLRSGNILYYDQIPTDVPASAYTHTQPQLGDHRLQPEVLEGVHRLRGRCAGATRRAPCSTPPIPR